MADAIALLAGPSSAQLGAEVAEITGTPLVTYECRRFPDGETQVVLRDPVRARHVYLLQSTSPPVDQRIVELLLLADACRRAGAVRLTAVIPYFGYARQERRSEGESLGARVAAQLIATGGFDRLVLIDAHSPAIEGFLDMPIDHLTAVPVLAVRARPFVREHSVVVAPDLGAIRRARDFARYLGLPTACVHKMRLSGHEVEAQSVFGDVRGRSPIIVDDMLSTGATIEAAIGALLDAGAVSPVTVAVTHALLVGDARAVLRRLPIERLIATDTVSVDDTEDLHLEVARAAPLIATTIRRDELA